MTLRMADSVSAASLPAGMDAYAGYVNGSWPNWADIASRFPTSRLVSIDVIGNAFRATALDVERGDATPDQAPMWVDRMRAQGLGRPIVYTSVANAQLVRNYLGIRPHRLWTAHYTGTPHICGPSCGYGLEVPADGTQWVDHGGWDESLLSSDFFDTGSAAMTPSAAPNVAVRPQPAKENPVFIVDAVDTKTQFLVFDNGKVAELHSTSIGSGLTAPAGPSGVGVPYINGAQADVDNIAKGYAPA